MDNLFLESWPMLSQARAETYRWFAGVFAAELADEAIIAYQSGAVEPLFRLFKEMGLETEVQRVEKAIGVLKEIEDSTLELAADFAALYLLDGSHVASPYASVYLDENGEMYGAVELRMRTFLQKSGLAVEPQFREPSDHLSIYLSLMEKWCLQAKKEESEALFESICSQANFLEEGLLSWLPAWLMRVEKVSCKSDFYPAMSALLVAFIQEDLAYLSSKGAQRLESQLSLNA